MPRPKKDPTELRGHPRQVKFTDAEDAAYCELVRVVSAGGPRPLDAHLLLWLIAEECRRRGIPWPGDAAREETPTAPQERPALRQASVLPTAEIVERPGVAPAEPAPERFVERDAPPPPSRHVAERRKGRR